MNNDLISREALREDFYELEIHGTMAVKAVLPIIEERIDNLPAVDAVEVVHGSWIEDGYYDEPYVCSICGSERPCVQRVDSYADGMLSWVYVDGNYCPNCGARMDGERK